MTRSTRIRYARLLERARGVHRGLRLKAGYTLWLGEMQALVQTHAELPVEHAPRLDADHDTLWLIAMRRLARTLRLKSGYRLWLVETQAVMG